MFGRSEPEVLVVGAGPVGLFTALLLQRAGIAVELVDEQWRPASRSYALALHPASLALLEGVGVLARAEAAGHRVDGLVLHDGTDAQAALDFSRLPSPHGGILVLPQRALEEMLEDAFEAAGGRVLWNHRLADLEQQDGHRVAFLERLAKESSGYAVAGMATTVDKVLEVRPRFVLGADGHASRVRRLLGVPFPEIAPPHLFAVFELSMAGPAGDEAVLVLDDDAVDVMWPMAGRRCRWSFELFEWEGAPEARRKERLPVRWTTSEAELGPDALEQLVLERVPWFAPRTGAVSWWATVRFERRLAASAGREGVYLLGDAAHLDHPVGVHSMNLGLREAAALVPLLGEVVREGRPPAAVDDWAATWLAAWRQHLGVEGPPRATAAAAPWVAANAARILPCLPATGEELRLLLAQIGLEMPAAKQLPVPVD
jgi:2-polyprenyl-6-methoxyphenol hydroxylase-like FAD-dependent oxidoreductase